MDAVTSYSFMTDPDGREMAVVQVRFPSDGLIVMIPVLESMVEDAGAWKHIGDLVVETAKSKRAQVEEK